MKKAEFKTRLNIFRTMLRIRMVEEEIAKRYSQGLMRCPTHLSVGQEGVPAAVAESLRKDDYAVSTHRGHAHYLAKGGDLKRMLAEIYGKVTGCSRGRGGSMHLIDTSVGFMGTSAIVGNSIPIGVGFGLAVSLKGTDQICCIFLGDGATEEGVWYESMNFAAVRKLPVLFLCENNLYSVYSPLSVRQPEGRSIAKVAEAVGLSAFASDGNDAFAASQSIKLAIDAIRLGSGPWLIEFEVYRWREHCGPDYDNHIGYRTEAEFESWKAREPIARMRKDFSKFGIDINSIELAMLAELRSEVDEAFTFAESSPFPESEEAFIGEFA